MKVIALAILLTAGPFGLGVAHADSDGYYCIGPGYLAYQFGMDVPSNPIRVYVIPFGAARGIPAPAMVKLGPSQVHGMRCGADNIDVGVIHGIWHVGLTRQFRPTHPSLVLCAEKCAIPEEYIQGQFPNLGSLAAGPAYAKPIRVRLGPSYGGGEYILEVRSKVRPPFEKCELEVTSRMIEVDRNGKELHARTLFHGLGYRPCGD